MSSTIDGPSPPRKDSLPHKDSLLRIIAFSVAAYSFLETMPGTYALYRKQWRQGRISPVCVLYMIVRYLAVISLISNGIGFYSTSFTMETCKKFYLLPNVTSMLAAMAAQGLIFIRTWAISQRSKQVLYLLGTFLLLDIPVQMFGKLYHREASVQQGNCTGRVPDEDGLDWNIVYYIAHAIFDVVACATASIFLWSSATGMSGFMLRVLRHGIVYAVIVTFANLLLVFEYTDMIYIGIGSAFHLTVVMICSQRLILSTQKQDSDQSRSTSSTSDQFPNNHRTHSGSFGRSASAARRAFVKTTRSDSMRMQQQHSQGVFVLTETFIEGEDSFKRHVGVRDALPEVEEDVLPEGGRKLRAKPPKSRITFSPV